jgi:hypothetical protein
MNRNINLHILHLYFSMVDRLILKNIFYYSFLIIF